MAKKVKKCDSCQAMMINGVYCHESGCPEQWKDKEIPCWECGCDFLRTYREQKVCPDCYDVD